ncbi:uncharacterized protein LOC144352895 [Saccoglossus kowalevskii]
MASSENRLIVCVLFLYLIVTITCQMDCLTAWEECVKDDSCSMVLNYFKVHCNNSVPACQLTDPTGCQAVATAIAAQPLFQSCYCDSHTLEFAECNHLFRMLFDDSCIDNTESNTDGTLTPISNAYDDVVNCNTAKTLCLENDYCKAVYTYYMNSCPFRKNVCLAESSIGDTCMDARGHLNTTVLARKNSLNLLLPEKSNVPTDNDSNLTIQQASMSNGELEDETLTYISEPDVTTIGIDPIAVGPTGGYNGGGSSYLLIQCIAFAAASKVVGSKYQQFLQQCTPDRSSPSGCSGSLGKSTAAQAFYSSDIASTVKATTLEHKVVTDGEFEDETYSSEPDVTTMGIDSIAVGPTGGYNGRVADCQVSLFNGEAVISVPPDNDVRIPLKVTGCSTVCRCSRYGSLVNCDQLICVNVSAYCIYNGKSYAHNEVFRDPLHGNCVCFEGTVICSITEHSNFGLCLTHNVGVPCINIGYSLQEEKMMSDYVHETFLGSTVQQKLQFLIDTIHVNGTRNKSCKLKLNGHEPGVLMLSVNGETASNETDAVCRETLIRLSDLINTRAPCIITDILLSVLKVSTASGQPMGSAMPAKSCSSALQYAEQRKNGLGKNSRSNYSGICPY